MPTVSVLERGCLKFVSANQPKQGQLRERYTTKFIETMEEKGLIRRVKGKWRLTSEGEDAILQRPEIRRARSMGSSQAGQDQAAGESYPDEKQLALPMEA